MGLIAVERRRQIEQEGWDVAHDREHICGGLAVAAACYAINHIDLNGLRVVMDFADGTADAWPWHPKWDKRKKHDRRRSLVIAGALIAAELDRMANNAKIEAARGGKQEGEKK